MPFKLGEKTKAIILAVIGGACLIGAWGLVQIFPQVQSSLVAAPDSRSHKEAVDDFYKNAQPEKNVLPEPTVVTEVRWVVYITGSVNKPGVYRLPEGARVYQLVEVAGGLTPVADEIAINMAAPLADGDHLHVPQKGEQRREERAAAAGRVEVNVVQPMRPRSGLLDLNSATENDLKNLPGIGPALAQRIVQHRQKNGRFKQVADLIEVPGIGGKKLEAISSFITVK